MRLQLPITIGALLIGGIAAADDQATTESAGATEVEVVHFRTDSATLSEAEKKSIAKTAQDLKQSPSEKVVLKSYTDPRGSELYNDTLAARRAAAVRKVLMNEGVEPTRIVIAVIGEAGAEQGNYARDRRVEIETEPTTTATAGEQPPASTAEGQVTARVRLRACQGRTTVVSGQQRIVFDKQCPQDQANQQNQQNQEIEL